MADEKEVIVTNTDGGSGATTIIAVILVIALLVVLFLLFGRGMLNNTKDIKADVHIDTPSSTH
jgi:hypothetical protein